MEVKNRSTLPGCLYWLCTLWTLGLFPLILKWGEGHLAKYVDDDGVTVRSGKRYKWSEFTGVKRVQVRVEGIEASDEILLYSPRGKVSFHYRRMLEAQKVVDYALRHLPPDIKAL
jgi:hypothetical protein